MPGQGEVVCKATSAKFSSMEILTSFLKMPGHSFLSDGVVTRSELSSIYYCYKDILLNKT